MGVAELTTIINMRRPIRLALLVWAISAAFGVAAYMGCLGATAATPIIPPPLPIPKPTTLPPTAQPLTDWQMAQMEQMVAGGSIAENIDPPVQPPLPAQPQPLVLGAQVTTSVPSSSSASASAPAPASAGPSPSAMMAAAVLSIAAPAPPEQAAKAPSSTSSSGSSSAPAGEAPAELPAPSPPPPPPRLTAKAAVLMDADSGKVLYSLNPYEKRSPASLTKIVTALTAVSRVPVNDTTLVKVSANAAAEPSVRIGLCTGDRISVQDLLAALLLASGNDAATALAEHIGGSEKAFAQMMNKKAKELGALDSNFANAHGLDAAGHYSTAYDMALLSRALLDHAGLAELVKQSRAIISLQGKQKEIANINSFLWRYNGALGTKTGYTQKAGYSISAAAVRNGHRLIVVLLGCPSSEQRWADAQALMDYGMNNYAALAAQAARQIIYTVQRGDTLSSIAKRYHKSLAELLAANPGLQKNPDRLIAGQRIVIP